MEGCENAAANALISSLERESNRHPPKIELHFATVDMAVVVHHYGFDTTAKHLSHDLGHANRHWITDLEPGLSRHNGRYRLFSLIQKRPENRLNQISNTGF